MRAWIVPLLLAATSLAACGGGDEPADPAPATSVQPSVGTERWLAAVEVAPKADDLDAATERLRDPLGEALVVSPVDCFEGLPAGLDARYLIGAVGDSSDDVEQLVVDAGEKVLFTASVTVLCTD